MTLNNSMLITPLAEQILDSIAVDQVMQAIGRGRGVNRGPDNPLDVHVWNNVPLPMPIDSFVEASDILNPSVAERQLARNGIAFESATDAAKACPDLWPSLEAADKAMRRSESVSKPRGDGQQHIIASYLQLSVTSPFGNGPDPALAQVIFKRAGAGHRPGTAWVDQRILADAKATIEKLLACKLASFEVLRPEPKVPPASNVVSIHEGLRAFAPNISEVARRVGVSRAQLSNALGGRKSLARDVAGRIGGLVEARARGFCFGAFIDQFRQSPTIWPEDEDVPRQNAAWRSLIERDGPPPEMFVKVWAETRCRWDTHVALAAKYTTSGRPDHRP